MYHMIIHASRKSIKNLTQAKLFVFCICIQINASYNNNMSSTAICTALHDTICQAIAESFAGIGIQVTNDMITCDLARFNTAHDGSVSCETTFSLHGVENVQRKPFQESVIKSQQCNAKLQTLKVKFKRPEKNVRFYLKYGTPPPRGAEAEAQV